MKNAGLIAALLVATSTCMVGTTQAQPQKKGPVRRLASATKEKAQKQWQDSLSRFQRCLKKQCSKMEALKAARDLGIAAVVAATAVFVTGVAVVETGKFMQKLEYFDTADSRSVESVEEWGRAIKALADPRVYLNIIKMIAKYPVGKEVEHFGKIYTVKGYLHNPKEGDRYGLYIRLKDSDKLTIKYVHSRNFGGITVYKSRL